MKNLLLLFLFPTLLQAQLYCPQEDQELVETHLMELHALNLQDAPMGEIVITVGQRFLGTPYEARTLEIEGEEQLVVYLNGLDCTTFLENVVVFSRLVKQGKYEFEDFTRELANLRYRDGEMDRYPSRLHYFSEWLDNNEKKGIIQNVTEEIGGQVYDKPIDFMSTHREAYQQLADDSFYAAIQQQEATLNSRKHHYIPKEKLAGLEKGMQSGDLIAITSGVKGLDIVHVGIAIRKNGRIYFLHASSSSNKVEITDMPLADYLAGNKRQTGVMVGRLVD